MTEKDPAAAEATVEGYTQQDIDAEVARLELDGSKDVVSTVVESRAFINGEYVPASSGEWFTTSNPATGKVVAKVASCDEADVHRAVQAARTAFDSGVWSDLSPDDRKNVLLKFASLIEQHALELAVLDFGLPHDFR